MEAENRLADRLERILDGEVAGGQPEHLRLGQVAQVGLAALGGEEDVSLPQMTRVGG